VSLRPGMAIAVGPSSCTPKRQEQRHADACGTSRGCCACIPQAYLHDVHLDIADYRLQVRAPVDDAVLSIDQPTLKQGEKRLVHCVRMPRIHREDSATPVQTGAHALQLLVDSAAVLLLPLHHLRDSRDCGAEPGGDVRASTHTFSRNFCLPSCCRVTPSVLAKCLSTTLCVAMPAWSSPVHASVETRWSSGRQRRRDASSVPGTHSTDDPRRRWYRANAS
jgi:hypothetical protein